MAISQAGSRAAGEK